MSPDNANTVSDHQSDKKQPRRGRPPFPRSLVLAAADALFADTDAPHTVSMDDIAAAAGVGKGTLFRAFGSRDNLLDALFAERMASLREAIQDGAPPLGPGTQPRERVLAILDALLTFKLDNRHLARAREVASSGMLRAEYYRLSHATLRDLIEQAGSGAPDLDADYAAHVLLGALRPDLIDELLASGQSPQSIRSTQAALVRRILN
ncbi:TetR/AcrR family transcriptional regulator [Streptacidiphilus sp. 4-A2]|nr:TetR/AcrR family transcriptional regulator [Streptacidiphilus sp. 4-A2]